jgi:hypothetical protein
MKDYEPCQLNSDGSGFSASKNVNRMQPKCKFEPYRQEFFQKDSKGIYIYRQQVLFNLYAFSSDMQSSYALNKVPELKLNNCKFKYFLKDYFVQITQASVNKPILAKLGQDKGGRVHI